MNTKNGSLEKLLTKINDTCIELHSRYNINYGGCCFVAYVIAKNFDDLGIRYKFAIADDDFFDNIPKSLESRRLIKSRQSDFTYEDTRGHYYLKVNKTNINSVSWHNHRDTLYIGCINSNDIKYLYDEGYWNSYYNVNFNCKVEEIINSIFEDYEKEN